MSRIRLLAPVAAAVLFAPTASAGGEARPALTVADLRPAVVLGTGFVPGERVTVLLSADRFWSRRATAGAKGAFRVRFRAWIDPCGRYSVHALGSNGSRARTVSTRRLDCAPAGDR